MVRIDDLRGPSTFAHSLRGVERSYAESTTVGAADGATHGAGLAPSRVDPHRSPVGATIDAERAVAVEGEPLFPHRRAPRSHLHEFELGRQLVIEHDAGGPCAGSFLAHRAAGIGRPRSQLTNVADEIDTA